MSHGQPASESDAGKRGGVQKTYRLGVVKKATIAAAVQLLEGAVQL
jgi:hypothetical protein